MPQIVICYADFFHKTDLLVKIRQSLQSSEPRLLELKKIVIIQSVLNIHKTIKAFI